MSSLERYSYSQRAGTPWVFLWISQSFQRGWRSVFARQIGVCESKTTKYVPKTKISIFWVQSSSPICLVPSLLVECRLSCNRMEIRVQECVYCCVLASTSISFVKHLYIGINAEIRINAFAANYVNYAYSLAWCSSSSSSSWLSNHKSFKLILTSIASM